MNLQINSLYKIKDGFYKGTIIRITYVSKFGFNFVDVNNTNSPNYWNRIDTIEFNLEFLGDSKVADLINI